MTVTNSDYQRMHDYLDGKRMSANRQPIMVDGVDMSECLMWADTEITEELVLTALAFEAQVAKESAAEKAIQKTKLTAIEGGQK